MDQGWAVVLGAVIAIIGSSIVPWLREHLTRKAELTRQRREMLAETIERIITLAGIAHADQSQFPQMQAAATKFAVLVTTKDQEISYMVHAGMAYITKGGSLAIAAYVAMMTVLPAWYRGEISAHDGRVSFELDMAKAKSASAAQSEQR